MHEEVSWEDSERAAQEACNKLIGFGYVWTGTEWRRNPSLDGLPTDWEGINLIGRCEILDIMHYTLNDFTNEIARLRMQVKNLKKEHQHEDEDWRVA